MRRLHEAAAKCPHESVVRVTAYAGECATAERLTICRDCHRVPGPFTTSRWKMQDDEPAHGARLMPWMWDAKATACFKVPTFLGDTDPPFLIPTVHPNAFPFVRDVRIGDHAAFLASVGLQQWIEGRVVFTGDNADGVRGIVATTTQGLTLRGNEREPSGHSGGRSYWGSDFIGDEERLDEIIAIHREAFPIAV